MAKKEAKKTNKKVSKSAAKKADTDFYLDEKPNLVSIGQAAKILGVSVDTVRRWDKDGVLHSERPDGKNRHFNVEELEAVKFSQPLTISEASEQLNLSPSTLRRIEKKGLISPERNEKGERIYTRKTVEEFIRSEYFMRQKEVEEEILKPLNGDHYGVDENEKSAHDGVTHAVLGEHQTHITSLNRFKTIAVRTLTGVTAFFVTVVVLLTLLFLLFPESTGSVLGYYERGSPDSKQYIFKEPDSLIARQLKPFSQAALRLVETIDPNKRNEIDPPEDIPNVNDVFGVDSEGNISSRYSFTVPDTSYLRIPDQGLVVNLNSDYLRGYIPGDDDGDLAILPLSGDQITDGTLTGLDIADGTITEADLGFEIEQPGSTFISTPDGTVQSGVKTIIAGIGLSGGGNGEVITLNVGAGAGLTGLASQLEIDVSTASITALTASNSGLEVSDQGLRLLGGCSNNQVLAWNAVAEQWQCRAVSGVSSSFNVSGNAGSTQTVNSGDTLRILGSGALTSLASTPDTVTLSLSTGDGLQTNAGDLSILVNPSGSGLSLDGSGLSLDRTCSVNQILKWTGSGWVCAADNSGGGGGSIGVQSSDGSVSVNPATTLEFGPTTSSSDEFIVSNQGGGVARVRAGTQIVQRSTSPVSGDISGSYAVGFSVNPNSVALGTDTTGNYIESITSGSGLIVSGVGAESATANITIDVATTGATATTANNSGLEVGTDGLRLLGGCGDGQILKWNATFQMWMCSADNNSGGGGSSIWSDLQNPVADLTLNHGLFSTTFNWGGTAPTTQPAQNALTFTYTNNGSSDPNTQRLLVLKNEDNGINDVGNVRTEALLRLEHNDDSTLDKGIEVIGSVSPGGFINTGLDVSDGNIRDAVNVGANNITGTTADIEFDNLDFNGSFGILELGALAIYTGDGDTTYSSGGGGLLILDSSDGQIITDDGDVLIIGNGSGSVLSYNAITNAGGAANGGDVADDNDLYIQGALEVDNNVNLGGNLTILGSTVTTGSNLTLNVAGASAGQLAFANNDTLNIGGATGLVYNAITNAGGAANGGFVTDDNDLYIQGALEVDGAVVFDTSTFNCIDCIDYDDLEDILDLDASTVTNLANFNLLFNQTGSGDVIFQDNGLAFLTLSDTGAYTYLLDSVDNPGYTITNQGSGAVVTNLAGSGNFQIQDNGFTFLELTSNGSTRFVQQAAAGIEINADTINSTTTAGVLDIDVGTTTNNNKGFSLSYTVDDDASAAAKTMTAAEILVRQADTSGNTTTGLRIAQQGVVASGAGNNVDALIVLDNADTDADGAGPDTAGILNSALRVDGSGTGIITNAFHINTTNVVNDIVLQNGEIIDNDTDGIILFTSPNTQTSGHMIIGDGAGNDTLQFTEEATNPVCGPGEYKIWANSTESLLKKCQNGALSDLDAAGAWNQITPPTDVLDLNHQEFYTHFIWDTDATAEANDYWTFSVTNDSVTDTDTQRLLVVANNDDGSLTGSTETLLYVTNNDSNEAVANGIVISAAGGGITTGLDFDSANIVTDIEFQNDATLSNDDNNDIDLVENGLGLNLDFGELEAGAITYNSSGELAFTSTAGTADAVDIHSSGGGVDIRTTAAAAGEDIDLDSSTSVNILANEAVSDAIVLNALNAIGGIDVIAGTGDIDVNVNGAGADFLVDAGGAISLDAVGSSSNFSVNGTNLGLTLEAIGGGTNVLTLNSAGTGTNALDINVTGVGGDLDIDVNDAITIDSGAGGMTFTTSGGNILLNNSSGTGDVIVETDADSNFQVNAVAIPGTDMATLSNAGFGVTADAVDGLSINFVQTSVVGERQNAAIRIDVESGSAEAEDNVEAIFIGNVTNAGSGSETAIRIGSNWDTGLSIGLTDADFDSGDERRDIDVVGSWGGNAYREVHNDLTDGATQNYTVTQEAVAYELVATCATDATATANYNITGLPNTDGTFAFVYTQTQATDTTDLDANETCTLNLSVNADAVNTNSAQAAGTLATTTVNGYESFSVVRIDGNWRAIGIDSPSPETVGTDLAEWMPYIGEQPLPGDIVSIVPGESVRVQKSTGEYDSSAIGIVATQPGVILGQDDGQSVLVALAGRVPLKVSDENGPVKAGDYLTASSTLGVAMKATKSGVTIGKAFEDFNGTGQGVITAFVNTSYYSGGEMTLPDGLSLDLNDGGLFTIKGDSGVVAQIDEQGNAFFEGEVSAKAVRSEQIIGTDIGELHYSHDDSLTLGELVSIDTSLQHGVRRSAGAYEPTLVGVVGSGPSLLLEQEGAGNEVTVVASGTVSVKANTESGAIKPGDLLTSSSVPGVAMKATKEGPIVGRALTALEGDSGTVIVRVDNGYGYGDITSDLAQLDTRVTTLESDYAGLSSELNDLKNQPEEPIVVNSGQDIDWSSLTVGTLNVTEDLTVGGALVVGGPAEFQGQTVFHKFVSFMDRTVFGKEVEFKGDVTFNNNAAGYAVVKEGETRVTVEFDQPLASQPIITLSLGGGQFVNYSYVNVTPVGFEIVVEEPAQGDLMFTWNATQVRNVQVSGLEEQ